MSQSSTVPRRTGEGRDRRDRPPIVVAAGLRHLRLDWGGLVRHGRILNGLTMDELGAKIGVNGKTIQNWEVRGRRPMKREKRAQLARELFPAGTDEHTMILEG